MFATALSRYGITIMLTLLCAARLGLAQGDDVDEFDFDEIPVDEESMPYIGVGGGYTMLVSFLNYDELDKIADRFRVAHMDGPLLMHGGGGWTAVGVIPNVRLGVFGFGGSKETSADINVQGTDYKRTMRFSAGATAVQLDYAIPVFRGFTVAPGLMIGAGSYTLQMTQTQKNNASFDTSFTFNPVFYDSLAAPNANRQTVMSQNNYLLYPAVNLEYALTQFFLVRAGVGYSYSIAGDWTDLEDTQIANVPNIHTNGLTLQFGLFLGLFQQ